MSEPVPLCIDLDGTLIRSDTLYESLAELLRSKPLHALRVPFWLAGGKAALKGHLATHAGVEPASLPYREDFLAWIREEARTRPLFLVSAAHRSIAEAVAGHLGGFAGVLATDGLNLSGDAKARALQARFGEKGFDYAGNSADDLPVWRAARESIVVAAPARVLASARREANVVRLFEDAGGGLAVWFRAMRLYQWVKNLLLFLAPLAAHRLHHAEVLMSGVLAFLAFGLAASAGYLLNDLLDMRADRAHPRKCLRPLAAGELSARDGFLGAAVLIAASLAVGACLSAEFLGLVVLYLITGQLYSGWLKRKVLADVAVLAGLYTLRVIAGASAAEVPVSFWLLALCAYGFLSLALLKRYAELLDDAVVDDASAVLRRGYVDADKPAVLAFGAGAGIATSLVLALYVDSQASGDLYAHPEWLWSLVGLVLFGVGRLWITAGRGQMHDDPILFVFRDRVSLLLGALALAVVLAAI